MRLSEETHQKAREQMVKTQLAARGITNRKILSVFLKVHRHPFVPSDFEDQAYEDHPIQIDHHQTISQPYMVAFTLDRLELNENDRVLEIGTGSGYQTALLAELVKEVYSIEIIKNLIDIAKERLNLLGYMNVNLKHGNGRDGWVKKGLFDKIVVSAASQNIPKKLVEQLKENGIIILPLGLEDQELILGQKINGILQIKSLGPVRFVPLAG